MAFFDFSYLILGGLWILGFMTTPGFMAIFLLFVSLAVSLSLGLFSSTWYGVMVWLVFISGLMVIFLFFCALTPNLSWGNRVSWIPSITISASLGLIGGTSNMDLLAGFSCMESQPFVFFQGLSSFIMIWLGAYLLLLMIVVVKTCPSEGGSLREP